MARAALTRVPETPNRAAATGWRKVREQRLLDLMDLREALSRHPEEAIYLHFSSRHLGDRKPGAF